MTSSTDSEKTAARTAANQVVALNTANANLSIAWTAASATPVPTGNSVRIAPQGLTRVTPSSRIDYDAASQNPN